MKNHTENYETCVLGSINWIKIYVLHTNEKKKQLIFHGGE